METYPKINEKERKVLAVLAEAYGSDYDCMYFRGIAPVAKMELKEVRLAARSLKRKGLAEYQCGLFNDDGKVAGSGYSATHKGALLINACIDCHVVIADMSTGQCSRCWGARKCTKCGKPYSEHELKNGYMVEFEYPGESAHN